jgi:hypothetical protein
MSGQDRRVEGMVAMGGGNAERACYTALSGMASVAEAVAALKAGSLKVRPLLEYFLSVP